MRGRVDSDRWALLPDIGEYPDCDPASITTSTGVQGDAALQAPPVPAKTACGPAAAADVVTVGRGVVGRLIATAGVQVRENGAVTRLSI